MCPKSNARTPGIPSCWKKWPRRITRASTSIPTTHSPDRFRADTRGQTPKPRNTPLGFPGFFSLTGRAVSQPERTINLLRAPGPEGVGAFSITAKGRTTHYTFCEIRCEIGGRGFAVHKLGLGELYHVRVGRPRDWSCECLGFLSHGYCRHILG